MDWNHKLHIWRTFLETSLWLLSTALLLPPTATSPSPVPLFLAWNMWNETVLLHQRSRIAATKDFLPPSWDSSLLLPRAEDAYSSCQQLKPRYIQPMPGLSLLHSCDLCVSRRCWLQGGTSIRHPSGNMTELQVNCCFKGTPMYLILSGHIPMFFLGATKAKTFLHRNSKVKGWLLNAFRTGLCVFHPCICMCKKTTFPLQPSSTGKI